jgi:hypothetical protein
MTLEDNRAEMELLPSQIKARPKKAGRAVKPIVTGKTLPIRTVRIERSYGGEFIFEAVDVPGIVEYLDRTREWFATQPQVLSSSSEGALERGLRELTDFSQMVSFEWPAPPVALEMRYESGKRQQSPPPVVGDDYAAIAGIERRGVSSFVLRARTEELYATDRGVAIVHREETHIAEVEMRPLGYSGVTLDPITSGELVEVRSAAARMSAVVEDVLDILVSNSIENQPDRDGYYSLDLDSILDARGLAKKQKGAPGFKTYAAGHHLEAREAVIEAIQKLDALYVALEPIHFIKKKRLRDWDRVLNVQRYTLEEPSNRVHAVRYELGSWFTRWKSEHVQASRRILELDAKREAPAKMFARYFTQRRHEFNQAGRIVRRVRELFGETATEPDRGKNPQRSRNWLEGALNMLQADRIIMSWAYVESLDSLPRYKWFPLWLELHVAVILP